MYGKIFDSMYEGTLYGHWQAIVTLQQMLVLCNADGVVDMTPQALAARTSIPLEIITKGIEVLSEPDPYSRTPGEEGRRIILIDPRRPWGWFIVNHAKYKRMLDKEEKNKADRERIAERRNSNKVNDVAGCSNESHAVASVAVRSDVSQPVADVAHAYAYANTEEQEHGRAALDLVPDQPKPQSRFPEFWASYPRKTKRKDAAKAWASGRLDAKADLILADVARRKREHRGWQDRQFIPYPATYLRGEGWEDEIEPVSGDAPPPKRSAASEVDDLMAGAL